MMYYFLANFRRYKVAVASCILAFILFLGAVLAPIISPYDPYQVDLAATQGGKPATPSRSHIWGTDGLGRDYFSRAVYGGRISLSVGLGAMTIAIVIGGLIGSVAGYFGSLIDGVLMRVTDVIMSFPGLIVMMALSSIAVKPNVFIITVIVGALLWTTPARIVRSEFLALKERDFINAARAIGCSDFRIVFIHIVPNALSSIVVAASLAIPTAILSEAALSFLGFGIQPPTPSWGNMLNSALEFTLAGAWWTSVYPGLMITLAVLSFNFIGDGVRDALDPRLLGR